MHSGELWPERRKIDITGRMILPGISHIGPEDRSEDMIDSSCRMCIR